MQDVYSVGVPRLNGVDQPSGAVEFDSEVKEKFLRLVEEYAPKAYVCISINLNTTD